MKRWINRMLLAQKRRVLVEQLNHIDEARKEFDRVEPSLPARLKRIHAQELDLSITGRAARGW